MRANNSDEQPSMRIFERLRKNEAATLKLQREPAILIIASPRLIYIIITVTSLKIIGEMIAIIPVVISVWLCMS